MEMKKKSEELKNEKDDLKVKLLSAIPVLMLICVIVTLVIGISLTDVQDKEIADISKKEILGAEGTTGVDIGTNVVASFNEATKDISISSTIEVGTINRDKLFSLFDTVGRENIVTITFENEVYAPEYSYGLFRGIDKTCSLNNLTNINNINKLNTSNATTMECMFQNCTSLTSLDLSSWDTSNVTTMEVMFENCTSLTSLDLSNWNTENVTNMGEMFYECNNLTTIDVSSWDTSKVTNMGRMFYGCNNLTTINVSSWDTSKVANMSNMFRNCRKLTALDVSNWNTSNVTNMECMFNGCNSLTILDVSNWNTGNVTNMQGMFSICNNLATLDVSNWNTGNVTNMSGLFCLCEKLATIDVSNWNTENVIDMQQMFDRCRSLTELNVSKWDTQKVTDMYCMLSMCSSLTELNVSEWKTDSVTNMGQLFEGCNNLRTIDVSNWNTENVTTMGNMFSGCSSLTTLDLSNWDTKNVTRLQFIFSGCTNLTSIGDTSNWDTAKVTNMKRSFLNCSSLTTISMSNWDVSAVTNTSDILSGCTSLTDIYTPKTYSTVAVDLPSNDWYNVTDASDNNAYSNFKNDTFTDTVHLRRLINYNITYNLNDGLVEENPTTYNVIQSFTLNNPTKEGYIFKGWTEANGTTRETEVTINGRVQQGDLEYTAIFIKDEAFVKTHHYIYDAQEGYTKNKLVDDVESIGRIGEAYTTSKSNNIPKNYSCKNEAPDGYTGTRTEDIIEVDYYYELITPTINNEMEITATVGTLTGLEDANDTATPNQNEIPTLRKEDGEIIYNIKYTTKITDYIGKSTIKIVDTLPAEIDTDKSELEGGLYDEQTHTITWIENIENIDTFSNVSTAKKSSAKKRALASKKNSTEIGTYSADGTYTVEQSKQITIVYKDQNVTEDLVNSVKGETITYYPEGHIAKGGNEFIKQEVAETTSVKQVYTVDFRGTVVWDDNENAKGKRPESVIIEIVVGASSARPGENSLTKVLNEENNWTYEELGLPKYDEQGEKITYIITQKVVNEDDLEYYEEAVINNSEQVTDTVTNNVTTITNTYRLMNTDLNSTITVEGTKEITTNGQNVEYKINLTGQINDYIGEGKVKIVCNLPYRINETESNLASGIYDDVNKTVTWEDELPHINTLKSKTPYNIDITKNIVLAYKDIDLEQENIENQITGKIELYETEEKDEKEATLDIPITAQGSVIVKYIDKETNKEIINVGAPSERPKTYSYEITGKVGTEYTAEKKEIEKYIYVEGVNETGKIKEKKQEAILYYESTETKVIVKYQDTEGNSILEDEIVKGYIGDKYKLEEKEIEKYKYVETKGNTEGTMKKEDIVVTYVYEPITKKIAVKYVDIDTEEDIIDVGEGSVSARTNKNIYLRNNRNSRRRL